MTTRAEVVACARSWINTPYQHQARLKGIGADCLGLVIGVSREKKIVAPDFDVQGYERQPDGKTMLRLCDQYMTPIPRHQMCAGHVVVVAYDAAPGHMGIVGDYLNGGLSIIHALGITAKRVVETRLMFTSSMRFVRAYSLPGVA